MSKSVLVDVKNLQVLAKKHPILNRVSFQIEAGDFIALVGPNGSGKTTLLKSLMKIMVITDGEIIIKGKTLRSYSQKDLAKIITYVPQMTNKELEYTVTEFVQMSRYAYCQNFFSNSTKGDAQAVLNALKCTDTLELGDRKLNVLSGGEFQRVLIAAALAQEPSVLLLDEPMTFLDPHYQAQISKILHNIHSEHHITILMVTHDMQQAVLHAHKIIALKNGELYFNGTTDDFLKNRLMERVFDHPFFIQRREGNLSWIVMPEIKL